jgi:hypothetical protein
MASMSRLQDLVLQPEPFERPTQLRQDALGATRSCAWVNDDRNAHDHSSYLVERHMEPGAHDTTAVTQTRILAANWPTDKKGASLKV